MGVAFSDVASVLISLACVLVLASFYGALRQQLRRESQADILSGLAFGVSAMISMHQPLEPVEGLLIDMRNVPVALAGAFLGVRGLAMCLLLAIGYRVWLGGFGMPAGVAAIVIAGCMGWLWQHMTQKAQRKDLKMILGLALMMSAHVGAALLLPRAAQDWFLAEVAPFIVLLNIVSIGIAGSFLEFERRRQQNGETRQLPDLAGEVSGFLQWTAFGRALQDAGTMSEVGPPSGLLVVSLRHKRWLFGQLDQRELSHLFQSLRAIISAQVPGERPVGQTDDMRWVIPMSEADLIQVDHLRDELRRAMSDGLEGSGKPLQISVDIGVVVADASEDTVDLLARVIAPTERADIVHTMRRAFVMKGRKPSRKAGSGLVARAVLPSDVDRLFGKAEILMADRF